MKDPYIDSNGVLKNKLNITDYDELKKAEADIGFLKLINVDSVDVRFFDEELIRRIHHHIFSDIFDWAGEYRTIPLFKEELVLPRYSIPYSSPDNISKDLKDKITELNSIAWQNMTKEEIASTFARKMALLWRVHPFRDGNTRTMLSFSYLYAKEHGFPFDIETFTSNLNRQYNGNGVIKKYSVRDKFVLACLDDKDYPEPEALTALFLESIENYKEKNNTQNKRK